MQSTEELIITKKPPSKNLGMEIAHVVRYVLADGDGIISREDLNNFVPGKDMISQATYKIAVDTLNGTAYITYNRKTALRNPPIPLANIPAENAIAYLTAAADCNHDGTITERELGAFISNAPGCRPIPSRTR